MASEFPAWLKKYSNGYYVTSVLETLATRERQREIARSASWQHSLAPERGAHSTPFSGMVKLHKPSSAESKMHEHYSVAVGNDPANQRRNRYGDIHPYDRTRVVVTTNSNAGERYLNASWVLERSGCKWWIASQAPLPHTAHTFLSLFLQPLPSQRGISRIRTVVQLTNDVEGGRRKAHPYYPTQVGQSILISPDYGDDSLPLIVTLKKREVVDNAHCVWSTLSLMPVASSPGNRSDGSDYYNSKEQHPVIFDHLLYTSWPDHGVPQESDQASLLAFIRLVDKTNRNTSLINQPVDTTLDPDPPMIVHCSAGIGRTGSFIAISSLLRKFGFLPRPERPCPASFLPQSPLGDTSLEHSDDLIVQEVDSLREQRPGMVQRNEQDAPLFVNSPQIPSPYLRYRQLSATVSSKGLYPYKEFPGVLGKAGTIVALPTDEAVLNDVTYKKSDTNHGRIISFVQDLGLTQPTYPYPDNVSTRIAAATLLQGLTAYAFTEEAYNVKIKSFATVIGTRSTPEKAKLVKKHGVDHVILYENEDTVSRVLEIMDGKGVDEDRIV
ncbi:hypothetical protein C0992_008826 [Termitomyces sp. T32_za158]|nr:hypothetical protein C0992_008826 [Termitomyces sp. T32_za158]